MEPTIVRGDLLRQDVEVIVNAWNRNVLPWWLLWMQGVSAAVRREAGRAPFVELARMGPIPLGEARLTGPGESRFKAIIHVAGINLLWMASERSVRQSVMHAMQLVDQHGFRSVAFPLIGAGAGQRGQDWSRRLMLDQFAVLSSSARVLLVEYAQDGLNGPG